MKILHLITTLEIGGAELMLYRLLSGLDQNNCTSSVVSLIRSGPVGKKIASLGVPVSDLGLKKGDISPRAFFKFRKVLSDTKPDILQTWLYHSDFLGLLAVKTSKVKKIVWNVRSSPRKFRQYKKKTALIVRLCSLLSGFPDAVIINSDYSKKAHLRIGYHPKRFKVIYNGFDLNLFKPDTYAYQKFRHEMGIPEDSLCLGMIARFEPMKDHLNFFKAAKIIHKKMPAVRFVLCGDGINEKNPSIAGWVKESGIDASYVYLLGLRRDVSSIMAALDIVALPSASEGFPNVVGEAMACGAPCVVKDVGDSALIVGNTGKVVPHSDPEAFASGVLDLLSLSANQRQMLGKQSRGRIQARYSIDSIIQAYEDFYHLLMRF